MTFPLLELSAFEAKKKYLVQVNIMLGKHLISVLEVLML